VRCVTGSVTRYHEAMEAHDWAALRSTLADGFTRVGPYPEHVFADPDAYTAFLADLLPGLRGHEVVITRQTEAGDVVHVELTETVELEGRPSTVRVCAAFTLAPDGLIRHVEVFVRRPGPGGI
jgi:hypothetical protein